jgi:hypothetical protein
MQLSRSLVRSVAAGAALLAVSGALGCAAEPMLIPSPTPSYTSTYETPAPTALAPLTGVEVPAGSLAHSALAAKIDNHPDARPQVGLARTDIVYEELVEGGATRYVAIWHSDIPAEIGPVRSIRPMDPDIVSPLGGIIAYSGGQQRFVALMRGTNVYNAIHGQSDTEAIMFRTKSKDAPHNVLVKAPELLAMHPEIPAPPQQYAYAPDVAGSSAVREGTPVSAINLAFSRSSGRSWVADPATGRWLRSQDGVADLDDAGAQLSAANVIVIRVPVTVSQNIPKTELIGSGEAWISTAGHTIHATWFKGDRLSPVRLVDAAGNVIRLAPGNSWIELVPNAGSAEFVPAPAV